MKKTTKKRVSNKKLCTHGFCDCPSCNPEEFSKQMNKILPKKLDFEELENEIRGQYELLHGQKGLSYEDGIKIYKRWLLNFLSRRKKK